MARGFAAAKPVFAITPATSPKTPIGANFIIHSVILIMTWNVASQKREKESRKLSDNLVIKKPNSSAKKIKPSICPSAAALIIFGGTIRIKISATSPAPFVSIDALIAGPSSSSMASNSPTGRPSNVPGETKLISARPIRIANNVVVA